MIRAISHQTKIPKLVLFAGLLLAAVILWHPAPAAATTACPTDTSRGTVTGSFTVPTTTTYRTYARMMASSSTNNTFVLEIDGTCYNMGGNNLSGAAVPIYSGSADWTADSADWVDTESGSTTPVDISLTSGTHNYVMIGNADNVRVDRVLFSQVSGGAACVPTDTGDNCGSGQVVSSVSAPFYMQAGGPGFTDATDNITWQPDQYYTQTFDQGAGGSTTTTTGGDGTTCPLAVISGQNEGCTGHAITVPSSDTIGPKNQEAYQTERWGGFHYDVPIANGTYDVILNFAEINPASNGSGSRIVDITSSNSTSALLTGYNISANGSYVADSKEFTITVTNGSLNLAIGPNASSSNDAKLSSLEILAHTTNQPPPTCSANANPAPIAPTGTTQNSSNTTYTAVAFSWNAGSASSGCTVDTYYIFRDGTMIGQTANGTTLTFTDTTAGSAGTTHNYQVKTHDSGGNVSVLSTATSLATKADNVAPNIPTNLAATSVSASTINLTWTGSTDLPNPGGSGIQDYNVYRAISKSTTFTLIGNSTTTSYSDTSLSPLTQYTYYVTAVDNANNESAGSATAFATTQDVTCSGNPTTPGTPTKTGSTVNSITFNWTTSTASGGCALQGYHIYRADVGGGTTPIATVTSGNSYTDTSLIPNTSYSYTVKAFDTSAHSSSGSTASIATTPDSTAPSAPSAATVTATSPGQINLTWTASTDNVGVTQYKVYRTQGTNTTTTTVSSTTVCSGTSCAYTDSTVSGGTSYTYQLSALDGSGNESTRATTSPASVTTPTGSDTTPPSAPTNIQTVVASQSAQLTWTASTDNVGVSGYNIYMKIGGVDVFDATSNSPNYTDTCLEPGVTYIYDVKAFDTSGNVSGATSQTIATPTSNTISQGDINCDFKVGFSDLTIMAGHWSATNQLPRNGDITGDGKVNFQDLQVLAGSWGKSW